MTKPFAASAFRAYASFDVSDTQLSNSYFTDGPRTGGLQRWAEFDGAGFGVRGATAGLGRAGDSLGGRLDLLNTSAFSPASDPVSATFTAAATSDSMTLSRCGCASCMSYAQTQAEKAAYADAAWAAYEAGDMTAYAIDPGETALLDDIGDDTTTTTAIDAQEGSVVHSQIDHPLDADFFRANLSAGTQYKFILTPDDESGNPGSPDLLIEIYDSAGTLIQSYDSGSFGATERATFTAPSDGLYFVAVKGWTPADIGGYTLTAEINNNPTPGESGVLASINWGGNDNVVSTGNYDAQGRMIIKVYFSQTGDAPYGSADDPVVGVTWDSWAKEGCYAAFACYENVINVVFQEVYTQEEADFILAATASAPVILGRMRPPGEPNAGLGEFNVLASTWTEEGTAQGGYMWITFIHELGHGMGLAHPHDTGGGSEVMQGVSGDLATGYSYGDFDLNQGVFTTMSYNDGWQTAPHGNSDSDAYGYQGTLMALDIAMLQIKYGANTTYNNTDTVYALPDSNQPGTYYSCIWDTGGTDWIIAGAAVDCVIDLRAATIDYTAGGGGYISYEAGTYGGFTIAQGVVIENAIGGAGEDLMTGNTANNWLMGGLGDDNITGGDGDDRIEGGADNDVLAGGGGTDTVDYSNAAAGVTVDLRKTTAQNTGGDGTDTLSGFEGFIGSDFADYAIGTYGNDTLAGGDGNDRLDGIGGVDTTNGGLGDDLHYIDNVADVVIEASSEGYDRVLSGVNYTLGAGVEVEWLTTLSTGSSTNLNLTGNEFNNRIEGNLGANVLSGAGGNDTLFGWGGIDTLNGGDANDFLYGGDAADSLSGGAGADTLDGQTGADTTNGGAGDDLHYLDNVGDVVLEAVGEGSDRVLSGVSYTLAAGAEVEWLTTLSTGSSTNLNLTGNEFAQRIDGNAGANALDGAAGADRLYGYAGTDTLTGGDGDDSLDGGAGIDTTIGGAGSDLHYVDNAADVVVEGAAGGTLDRVLASVNYTLAAGVEVEMMTTSTSNGTTSLQLTGNEFAQRMEGDKGGNTLNGMGGADTLFGYDGNDTLNGGDGADSAYGGVGTDTANGGAGNDILDGGAGTDLTNGGAGDDLHYVDSATDVVVEATAEGAADRVLSSVNYTLAAGVEVEILTTVSVNGTGAQDLTGNDFGQRIEGNQGVNVLSGAGGIDTLYGYGGDDTLIGGSGNDTLHGGAGVDTFWFNVGLFGADTVADFANGSDQIRISGIAGVDDFSDLTISANGSGWAVITLPDGSTITLTGVTTGQVDASDFVFG